MKQIKESFLKGESMTLRMKLFLIFHVFNFLFIICVFFIPYCFI